jgi:hypothetical protein
MKTGAFRVQGLQALQQALEQRAVVDSMDAKQRLADMSSLIGRLHASVG